MKKLTVGLIIGLLIGTASTAIAATSDTVQAVFAKFSIQVNGETKQLANDPVVIDGVSYLPVREVAGLLGYDVDFENGTIVLGNEPQSTDPAEPISDTEAVAPEPVQIEEGDESNMEQTINLDGWISLRDFTQDFEGSITLGGNDNLLTITLPTGEEFVMPAPSGDGDEFSLPFQDRDGSLSLRVVDGIMYLSIEQLRGIGAIN